MKILLINPPICNDIGHPLAGAPPLALLYLAAYLRKQGYKNIKVIDADTRRLTWEKLEELFRDEKPDIVGLSGTSLAMPVLFKSAKMARKVLPDAKIIAGGFGPTVEPEKVLRESDKSVDVVVMGEGELTLSELVTKFEKDGRGFFGDVKGIAYIDDRDNFVTTERREYIKDLDTVPWPAYDLLDCDPTDYVGMPKDFEGMTRPISVMLTTRGCPHRCIFCSLGSKLHRERGIKDVVDEIEFYENNFKAKSMHLYDDEFVGMSLKQNERVQALCNEIIKRGLHKKMAFLVQGRCSPYVELETLKKMREANIIWIWWGVESGSQKILDFIKKDIKLEDVKRDFALAKEAGIKSLMFIIVGFPKETPADIKMTADIIKKVHPDRVAVHIVSPYPGSELRKYLEDHKLLDSDNYYSYDMRHTVNHHTEEMTAKEIKKYYRMLVFRFENGYWYFIRLFFISLLTVDGRRNLWRRVRIATNLFSDWLKLNLGSSGV